MAGWQLIKPKGQVMVMTTLAPQIFAVTGGEGEEAKETDGETTTTTAGTEE